jgi:hypothetical protein
MLTGSRADLILIEGIALIWACATMVSLESSTINVAMFWLQGFASSLRRLFSNVYL